MSSESLFLHKEVPLPDKVVFLQEEVTHLKNENINLQENLTHRDEEIKRLNHLLFLLKKNLFAPKSEKYRDTSEESPQLVFNELEEEFNKVSEPPPEEETLTYTRKKGRSTKNPFPRIYPEKTYL